MGKLRLRKIPCLAQGHKTRTHYSCHLNPVWLHTLYAINCAYSCMACICVFKTLYYIDLLKIFKDFVYFIKDIGLQFSFLIIVFLSSPLPSLFLLIFAFLLFSFFILVYVFILPPFLCPSFCLFLLFFPSFYIYLLLFSLNWLWFEFSIPCFTE